MTPIYRSPDQDQASAIRSLLEDHNIQTSIIETKKANQSFGSSAVIWYELWLRHYADASRAKSIITQHEFTTYRTNMSAYRNTVVNNRAANKAAAKPSSVATSVSDLDRAAPPQPVDDLIIEDEELIGKMEDQPVQAPLKHEQSLVADKQPIRLPPQRRDDLIPINNKRVFKRLGLLLGYSEEEIEKVDSNNNKLYRPWDGESLMEKIRNLKQKCS